MHQLLRFTRASLGKTMFGHLPAAQRLLSLSVPAVGTTKLRATSSRREQTPSRRQDSGGGGWGSPDADGFRDRRASGQQAGPSQRGSNSRLTIDARQAARGGRRAPQGRPDRERQPDSDRGARGGFVRERDGGDREDDGDSYFDGGAGDVDGGYSSGREDSRQGGWGGGEVRGKESWRERKKEKQPTIRDDLFGEVLYGVAPVVSALKTKRRTAHVLYLQDSMDMSKRKDARAVQDAIRLAEAAGAAVRRVGKHELNLLSDDRPHQGLILDCSPLKWEPLDAFPPASSASTSGQHPIWLALDEVVDPQNLGAVIRSAYCLGASGVVASTKNCAPLSAVVSKASAGSLEALQLHATRNMARTLMDAAGDGWAVLGASGDRQSQPLSEFVVNQPTILVMGNEGYGLRTNVRRACTSMVRIEMGGGEPGQWSSMLVDSLNVSVATGILLHHLVTSARSASATATPAIGAPESAESPGGAEVVTE